MKLAAYSRLTRYQARKLDSHLFDLGKTTKIYYMPQACYHVMSVII